MKAGAGLCVTQLGPGKNKGQGNGELRATPVCVPSHPVPAQVAEGAALPILEGQRKQTFAPEPG